MELSREQFVADAARLEGKPFGHQGTDPENGGADCIHVPLYLIKRQVPLPLTIPRTYQQDSHNCRLIEGVMEALCERVPQVRAQSGDLYLFRPTFSMRHIGVQLTDGRPPLLLHPSSKPVKGFPQGRINVEPYSDRWTSLFRGCYRLPFGEPWGEVLERVRTRLADFEVTIEEGACV